MEGLDEVKAIAARVRKWAERTNKRRVYPFSVNLCGMCAIATVKLFKELKAAGITGMTINENDEHCFLMWRGMIIDVTATQFGFAPVTILWHAEQNTRIFTFWERKDVFDDHVIYVVHQREVDWPANQRARC